MSVKSTCSPAAGDEAGAVPVSFSSVTVNVCGWPISLVAFGVMWILAFTHCLIAGPELPARPFVVRVSETPPTETVVEALTVSTPVTAEV